MKALHQEWSDLLRLEYGLRANKRPERDDSEGQGGWNIPGPACRQGFDVACMAMEWEGDDGRVPEGPPDMERRQEAREALQHIRDCSDWFAARIKAASLLGNGLETVEAELHRWLQQLDPMELDEHAREDLRSIFFHTCSVLKEETRQRIDDALGKELLELLSYQISQGRLLEDDRLKKVFESNDVPPEVRKKAAKQLSVGHQVKLWKQLHPTLAKITGVSLFVR